MGSNDLVTDRQSQAGSTLFGAEKRFKDICLLFFWNTRATILKQNLNAGF